MAKRHPTPPHVGQRRGFWRAWTRPAPPTPPRVPPVCPPWMDTAHRRLWEQVTSAWEEEGGRAPIDATTLTRYVTMFVQWQHLATFLQAHGETCEVRHTYRVPERVEADGTVQPRQRVETTRPALRPEAQLALALADRLLHLEPQLGISPRARASISRALTAARQGTVGYPLTLDPRRFVRLQE